MEPFAGFPYKSIYGLPVEFNCSESIQKSFAKCETDARYEWSVTYDNYFYATKEFCCFAWKQLACELPLITQCNQPKYHELMESETVNMFNNICNDKDLGRESTTCRWKEIATTIGISVGAVILVIGVLCTCGIYYLVNKSKSPAGDKSNIFTRSFEFFSKKLRPSQSQPPAEAAAEAATSLSSSMASLPGESTSKLPSKYSRSFIDKAMAAMKELGVKYSESELIELLDEAPPKPPRRPLPTLGISGLKRSKTSLVEGKDPAGIIKKVISAKTEQVPLVKTTKMSVQSSRPASLTSSLMSSKSGIIEKPISSPRGSKIPIIDRSHPPQTLVEADAGPSWQPTSGVVSSKSGIIAKPISSPRGSKIPIIDRSHPPKTLLEADAGTSWQTTPGPSDIKGSEASLVEGKGSYMGPSEMNETPTPKLTRQLTYTVSRLKDSKDKGINEVQPSSDFKESIPTREIKQAPLSSQTVPEQSYESKGLAGSEAQIRRSSLKGSKASLVEGKEPLKGPTGMDETPQQEQQRRFSFKLSRSKGSKTKAVTEVEPSPDLTESIASQEIKQAPPSSQTMPKQLNESKDLPGIESKAESFSQPTSRSSSIRGSKTSLAETAEVSAQPASQTSSMMPSKSIKRVASTRASKISKIQPEQPLPDTDAEPSRVLSRRESIPLFVEAEVPHKNSMKTGFRKVPPPKPTLIETAKMATQSSQPSSQQTSSMMPSKAEIKKSIASASKIPKMSKIQPPQTLLEAEAGPSWQKNSAPSDIRVSKASLAETTEVSAQPGSQTSSLMSSKAEIIKKSITSPIASKIPKISKIQPPTPPQQQTIILGPAEPSTSSSISSSSSSSMSEALSVEQANLRAAQVTATKLIEKILPEVVKMMDKTQMPPPTPPQP